MQPTLISHRILLQRVRSPTNRLMAPSALICRRWKPPSLLLLNHLTVPCVHLALISLLHHDLQRLVLQLHVQQHLVQQLLKHWMELCVHPALISRLHRNLLRHVQLLPRLWMAPFVPLVSTSPLHHSLQHLNLQHHQLVVPFVVLSPSLKYRLRFVPTSTSRLSHRPAILTVPRNSACSVT